MKKGKILAALVVGFASSAAMADSFTTANFQVNATVNPACVIRATDVSFGAITPAPSGKAVASGTITSICTKTTGYTLNLYFDGEEYDNKMFHPDAIASGNLAEAETQLNFDIGLEQVGDRQKSYEGTGSSQTELVVAEMPLNQFVKPGNYSSNMHVRLSF